MSYKIILHTGFMLIKIKYHMTCRQIILYFVLPLIILSGCSSGDQFIEDKKIQNDITTAIYNYNSNDWEIRLNSIRNISKYSDTVYAKHSLMLLFKALDDSHSEVRIETLKILKKMKAAAAEDKIAEIASTDENSNVRFFAYSALEEYGNLINEDIFIKGLSDNDWLVQEASLKGLMKINDPEIQIRHINIIINAINHRNISIQLIAVSNISIKHLLIYNELSKIINNDKSGRHILKAALEKIRGYKLDEKTKKRIIKLLTHRDKNIRILSLQVLKQENFNLNL